MKNRNIFWASFSFIVLIQLTSLTIFGENFPSEVKSPNGKIIVSFQLTNTGQPTYEIHYVDHMVIQQSRLGFVIDDGFNFANNFVISETNKRSFSEDWGPLWGERNSIQNEFNEIVIGLTQAESNRKLNVIFRAFDDGIGFRYEFPEQEELNNFKIMDELTEFNFTGDHKCWWIPGDHDSYEYTYQTTKISEIDISKTEYSPRGDRFVSNPKSVNTPITLESEEGIYFSIHEADLTDYADMTLVVKDKYNFETDLVPWADGTKVKAVTPFKTPWRTIQIADRAADLLTSTLILNLNEPVVEGDFSWIEPIKYIGIWWEMHIDKSSWARTYIEGSWSGKDGLPHGATTENAKRYIDFAAENNIKGVLAEGWNTGWEYWGADTTGFFDFVTPYEDYDLHGLINYAKEKGVEIVGHNETGGDVENYDSRVEDVFKFYNSIGIRAVKTGYAGAIRPVGERHHGQYMVRHYQKVLEVALKYHIMIDAHEPIKDTGLRRTYPNMMTREGAKGMEWNAWSAGNLPEHTTILPFTRMLGGPMDYTPGIFDISIDSKEGFSVHSTIANQLALMVVLYSPLQMAADLVENYDHPAFQFIRDVPTDWDETIINNAAIGDYVTISRRRGNDWFVGSITDENERVLELSLDFLDKEKSYTAVIYKDAADSHYEINPEVCEIESVKVSSDTVLELRLAPGGGQSIMITED
ncbi:MAG: glycoside hydrolase family 97 protein [Bacteroidetes bacterium]|nr:glycoside hydrolase family 97 protein [Bacteroidota bacterium]